MSVITSLIAYWAMEEATGANAVDSVGTSTLTAHNGTGSIISEAGKVANGRTLAVANGQYFEAADSAALSTGNIDFSVALWTNLTAKTVGGLVGKGSGSNLEYGLLYHAIADRFRLYISSADGLTNFTSVNADTLGAPSIDTWYFIVAWHDATANTINIQVNNGTADSAGYSAGSYDSTETFYIGNVLGDFIDGTVDEVGFWKKVLTPTEITWLYNSGSGRSYADIVAEAGGPPASTTDGKIIFGPA